LHQPDQIGRIRHVAIVQQERHIAGVRVFVEVIDARGVERGRSPLDAVNSVAEAKQIFGQIGAILPGNAGEERNARFESLTVIVSPTKRRDCQKPARADNPPTLRWTGP
jgi:hypothetical protein